MRTGSKKTIGSDRRVALLSLATLILLGGCWACAGKSAPKPPPPIPSIPTHALYAYLGFTIWSCENPTPIAFVRINAHRTQEDLRATLVHEASHIAVAMSFPSCASYHNWRANPESDLFMEALAYCAVLRDSPTDSLAAVEDAVSGMVKGHRFPGLTRARARARLQAVCR